MRASPLLPAWNSERAAWRHSSHLETMKMTLRMESRRPTERGSSAPLNHCTSLGLLICRLPGT